VSGFYSIIPFSLRIVVRVLLLYRTSFASEEIFKIHFINNGAEHFKLVLRIIEIFKLLKKAAELSLIGKFFMVHCSLWGKLNIVKMWKAESHMVLRKSRFILYIYVSGECPLKLYGE
jgi:hypothetical protein